MNMEKKEPYRKSRDEKILLLLKNSIWLKDKYHFVNKEYKSRNNDEWYLLQESKQICRLLPAYWENSITDFLKTGKLSRPKITGAQMVYTRDSEKNEVTLYIRIFRKTKKDDVLRAYKGIKKYQKLLPEVLAPDIENDLIVLKVWEDVVARKRKPRNIALEVSTILINKHKLTLDEDDIRKRVSELRKLLGMGKKQG